MEPIRPSSGNAHTVVPQEQKKSSPSSIIALSGGLSATCETMINHPFFSIAKQLQTVKKVDWSLGSLYKGIIPNASSMIPATTIQVYSQKVFQQMLEKHNTSLESSTVKTLSAACAGAVSSIILSPTELVILTNRKLETTHYDAVKRIYKQFGWKGAFIGMPGTAAREMKFTIIYLDGIDRVYSLIRPHFPEDKSLDLGVKITAGIGTGIFVGLASHWIDTIKSNQQFEATQTKRTFWEAGKQIIKEKGFSSLMDGATFRSARIAVAVPFLNITTTTLSNMFEKMTLHDPQDQDNR